jgi:hypothetical protein
MSIFDKKSGFDPRPWLKEKTLDCLRDAAELVDLANESDTTPWYSRRLSRAASALIGRLAPMALLVHGAGQDALKDAEWNAITEHGTLALAAWCKRWSLADAKFMGLAVDADDEDDDRSAAPADRPDVDDDITRTLDKRSELVGLLAGRLMHANLTESARRLLLFFMSRLRYSPHPDIVWVSKRFLPVDIGASAEETTTGYRELYERELIERVDALSEQRSEGLALRLIVEGFNDRKHTTPYREETFGYPGARIDGKSTIGNTIALALPAMVQKNLEGWGLLDEQELGFLRDRLQEAVGEKRALIEKSVVVHRDGKAQVEVSLRYPMDEDERDIEGVLELAAEAWLREHLASVVASGGDSVS